MTPIALHKFDHPCVAAQEYRLPSEKLIAGNPLQTLWPQYTDASEKFSSGVWQSEVGKWRVRYTEEEYCQILQGSSVITDAQGLAVRVSAGESFVIPAGFVGTWEVLELTQKIYVVYQA